jgi:NADH-quinone oxidoreductase subunit H
MVGGTQGTVRIRSPAGTDALAIWYERRVVAFMQHRKGPNMNGPFGLLQSLADGMKLMFRRTSPTAADKIVFTLAPFVVAIP